MIHDSFFLSTCGAEEGVLWCTRINSLAVHIDCHMLIPRNLAPSCVDWANEKHPIACPCFTTSVAVVVCGYFLPSWCMSEYSDVVWLSVMLSHWKLDAAGSARYTCRTLTLLYSQEIVCLVAKLYILVQCYISFSLSNKTLIAHFVSSIETSWYVLHSSLEEMPIVFSLACHVLSH